VAVIGTNLLDGPDGATGWHVDVPGKGFVFARTEDVLVIRDLRYPRGFDAVWDARTEAK